MQVFINNFEAVITNNPGTSSTTFKVSVSDAGRLGALDVDDYYVLTASLVSATNPAYNEIELLKVTAVNTGTGDLTVEREYEGTSAGNWSATVTRLTGTVTKQTLDDLQHGPVRTKVVNAANYNITADDAGKLLMIEFAGNVQVSLPVYVTEALPPGFRFDIVARENYTVSFAVGGSDVFETTATNKQIANQYGLASVIKLEYVSGTGVSTWGLYGDVS